MNLTVKEIALAADGKIIGCENPYTIENIVTDSRIATKNNLFVALKGDNFDGHNFISDVIDKGCRAVLVEKETDALKDAAQIVVNDTKKALGDIAKYYISKKDILKIAVTGSVGKTTTKEMIASVCEEIKKTLKTEGNFNNDIGLPLTAYRLTDEKTAIFEMGMNHFGEIKYLSEIVKPDIAVITNIGHSHIENLGSQEGILKAKLEVLENLSPDGTIVLNGDDKLLYGAKDSIKVKKIYIGVNNKDCDITAENIKEEDNSTIFTLGEDTYKINLLGIHNVYNALVAIAVGTLAGGSKEQIKNGLLKYKPYGIRQNIVENNGYKIIADCYNAAPDSMLAALDVLSKVKGERKIAVFGSVAELGNKRDELLFEVGKKIKDFDISELITVTEDALYINKGAQNSGFLNEKNFLSNDETLKYLKENIKKGDVVLIKGSRKYKMEEISEGLLQKEDA